MPDGKIEFIYCSPSLNRLLGVGEAPLTYDDFLRHIHPDDMDGVLNLVSESTKAGKEADLTYRLVSATGEEIWIRAFATPRADENGNLIWDGCGIDVTAERLVQSRLSYLADHDILTGLENRSCFVRSVAGEIERLADDGHQVNVFVVDIGEFKEIRDVFGASLGDALLQGVAERLRGFVGAKAHLARLGEAEFGFVERSCSKDARDAGSGLQGELARVFVVGDLELNIQPEVGVANCSGTDFGASDAARAAEDLVKRAGIALGKGRLNIHVAPIKYSAEIAERVSMRVTLRQSLHRALEQNQFQVYYQPLFDLNSRDVVGAEALVRWMHPELGLQRPDLFIPLAEESGLIIPLGAWVLDQAMRQARLWDTPEFGSPRISVNVSGIQLGQSDFYATVARSLKASGVKPSLIELELTEGFLIVLSSKTTDMLGAIRELGVSLSIDDFGTGYSSFEYLKTLPVDKLKIDQSLVRPIGVTENAGIIVRAIIEMARSLKLSVVCEGIETEQQLAFLRHQGCHIGQGYLFAKPMAADSFEVFLKQSRGATPRSARATRRIRKPKAW
jgi:diguanylate cyclase (GGDEF)-like protein